MLEIIDVKAKVMCFIIALFSFHHPAGWPAFTKEKRQWLIRRPKVKSRHLERPGYREFTWAIGTGTDGKIVHGLDIEPPANFDGEVTAFVLTSNNWKSTVGSICDTLGQLPPAGELDTIDEFTTSALWGDRQSQMIVRARAIGDVFLPFRE